MSADCFALLLNSTNRSEKKNVSFNWQITKFEYVTLIYNIFFRVSRRAICIVVTRVSYVCDVWCV